MFGDGVIIEKIFPGKIHVKAIFALEMKWRLVEEFGPHCFEEIEDEKLLFCTDYTDKDNLISWLLTFGDKVVLLEPIEVKEEIKEDENTSNVFLQKDGTLFLLYRKADFEKMTERKFSYCTGVNGHFEIALSVDNYGQVDETFDKVVAAGAQSIMEPTTEPWGQRTCYVADPEGNLIEIGSFTK